MTAKLREGLWEAVMQSDELDVDDIDSILFQKLLLKAIDEFDLEEDVTVEWYLDGENIYANAADRELMGNKNAINSAHEFHLEESPTIDELASYYQSLFSDFQNEVDEGTFRYLREYYQNHPDIPYRELYLGNLDIDQTLSEASTHLEAEGVLPADVLNQFKDNCRSLKTHLLMHEEFETVPAYVDAFEDGGLHLFQQIRQKDLEPEEASKLVDEYDHFYYYHGVWWIVANIISWHNHKGPSTTDLREDRHENITDARERFIYNYNELSEWMEGEFGLNLPSLPESLPEVSAEIQMDREPPESPELPNSVLEMAESIHEEPSDIDLEQLMEGDDPSSPLSNVVIQERKES